MGSSAGRIGLGIVGAVAGTFLGVGPAVGFAAGSLLGGALFPPEGQNITTEGPRLQDLTVTSSTYGAPRPFGYGAVRVSGNIIWTSGIKENKATDSASSGGGKGGAPSSTQTTTTYYYTASWAIAFGEGPADDVIRLWADGKLIFDRTEENVITRVEGISFRFYPGDETQLPDVIIEEDKGVGRTPAFRGTVYLVFDDVPLQDFGNRIPNITAEVVYSANKIRPVVNVNLITPEEGGLFNGVQSSFFATDLDRGFLYLYDATGTVGFRRVNTFTMTEDRQMLTTDVFDQTLPNGTTINSIWGLVLANGDLVVNNGVNNYQSVVLIDGNSMKEKGRFGTFGVSGPMSSSRFPLLEDAVNVSLYDLEGRQEFIVGFSPVGNEIGVLRVDGSDLVHVWNTEDAFVTNPFINEAFMGMIQGAVANGEGQMYFATQPSGFPPFSDNAKLYRIRINAAAGLFGVLFGVKLDTIAEFTPTQLVGFSTYQQAGDGLVYDKTDGNVIFHAVEAAVNGLKTHVIKINVDNGDIIWNTVVDSPGPNDERWIGSRVEDGTLGFVSTESSWYEINTITGDIIGESDGIFWPDTPATGSLGVWDSRSESWIAVTTGTLVTRFLFRRSRGNEANLGALVENICERVGIDSSDIDVTDLNSITVPGYVIGRQLSARSALQPLAQLYQFDGVESDFKLKFVRRGQTPTRTITQAELATTGDKGEFFTEQRTQEVELPERYNITYLDRSQDYEQNSQSAKRIRTPDRTMNSRNQLGFSIAGAFDASFIKLQAEKLLYTAWAERSTLTLRLPWTHLDLDPSDVVNIELDNGTTFRTRLTELDLGDRFTLEATAISEEDAQYVDSSTTAFKGDGPLVQVIRQERATRLILLDSPLLRDSHEPSGRSFAPIYFFMGGFEQGQFGRGLLYKSTDGVDFDEIGTSVQEMTWGTLGNTIPDPPLNEEWQTDEINSINVSVVAGADNLVSVSQLQMLNGANAIAVLKFNGEVEIMQFRDVVQNTDFTFTLSGLLRGRRGTDTMAYNHTVGEAWVLLSSTTGDQFPLTLSEKDTQRFYRAVQNGTLFENAPNQTLTSRHRALQPYSVTHQAAAPSGNDIVFTWIRRARVGALGLNEATGTIPLAEDSEEYEIDILDGPAGSIVRTVTGLASPTYTYTSANQTTDGFTPPLSEISVVIYQISAQVGRGFGREITLPVE